MAWQLTDDVEVYAARVDPLLAADPVRHTISINAIAVARAHANRGDASWWGWWAETSDDVQGAVSCTPPFGLLLGVVPEPALEPLVATVETRGVEIPAVNGPTAIANAFASRWCDRVGVVMADREDQRLFRLDGLIWPDPPASGRWRFATRGDRDLVMSWWVEFIADVDGVEGDLAAAVDDRLSYQGILLWVDDEPVSMAAVTRVTAGAARIGPVYTPPRSRGHGYAATATAAASQLALDRGAEEVCLFTQAHNPLTNRLYPRLGYRWVDDRSRLAFGSPDGELSGARHAISR